eukprot:Tamp_24103.p1 GENE.Tamp_24103~~Tamp_24103.p1  ORF type:complete len:185 (-),score=42.54 Tamp_24103:251-805(-)
MPGPSSKKEANANALAAFHHVVAKGQIERVKDFVLGGERNPLIQRVDVKSQDNDGLAAVHWAAMRGHKKVLQYLIEGAPEGNRADPAVVDKHGWSAAMWAVFMVEQEQQMVGSDHGKRKELCDVINYLAKLPAAPELLKKPDKLLHKDAVQLAQDAALASDEGVLASVKGEWDSNKTYAVKKED